MEQRVTAEKIDNVIFFGRVDKKYIPDIVAHATLLLCQQGTTVEIGKYGMSQNKLFDYFTGGKAILSNVSNKYSIIEKYDCGIERELPTAKSMAQQIKDMINDSTQMQRWGENAFVAAEEFSFEQHTRKLIQIIEKCNK